LIEEYLKKCLPKKRERGTLKRKLFFVLKCEEAKSNS
jgi:hypothetical protein